MANKTILIIDDEELIRKVLKVKLNSLEFNTILAKDGPEGLDILEKNKVDIIFCDIFLPGMTGFEVIKEIKKKFKDTIPVIAMTAYANLKTAVKAFEYGAFDYLIKPFTMEEIPYILNKALKFQELVAASTKAKAVKAVRFSEIIGASDYIMDLKKKLQLLIHDSKPCLINGYMGTGKKYIAKTIAKNYINKSKKDFYYVNLQSFNENQEKLIKSVFNTNFVKEFKTKVVIIDNIHLINPLMQDIAVNNLTPKVKYIFISNKKITNNTYKKYFNELFFNLFKDNILFTIPLKEYKEDIPLLIQNFIKIYNKKYNKNIKDVDKDSFYYLLYYNWPDNIMELESIIEKVILLAENNTITSDLLYDFIHEQKDLKVIILNPRLSYQNAIQSSRDIIDKKYIIQALNTTKNNKTKAAKLLGISLRQFQYKCKSLGI